MGVKPHQLICKCTIMLLINDYVILLPVIYWWLGASRFGKARVLFSAMWALRVVARALMWERRGVVFIEYTHNQVDCRILVISWQATKKSNQRAGVPRRLKTIMENHGMEKKERKDLAKRHRIL